MKYKVPFIKPSFPNSDEICSDYAEIVQSNWFTNFGPFEQRFRKEVAEFIGQSVSVATAANATFAIDLAVRALFVQDDERNRVIVPSFTFAAGPEVLISQGYKPIFVDISENNWQPDIKQAEAYIKANHSVMAGILLCNIFGVGNKQVEEWEVLAKKYNLSLIIDSAAGFGSMYEDRTFIGARGDCEIFSLHATKPFAVGEGGLVVSRSNKLIAKIMELQNFGFNKEKNITSIGTNAKLQELNCAIGLRQLKNLKDRVVGRQSSLALYKDNLGTSEYFFQDNDIISSVPFVSVISNSQDKTAAILSRLSNAGVESKQYYAPLHQQRYLEKYCDIADGMKVTEMVSSKIISLPLHDNMDKALIREITDLVLG